MLIEKLELSNGAFSLIRGRVVSSHQESAKTAKHSLTPPNMFLSAPLSDIRIKDLCGEDVVNMYLQSAC